MASPSPATAPLASAMVTLVGVPDHSPRVDALLVTIAKLAADRVAAATYASITALQGKAYITVAVSDDLIMEIDQAQYADNAGPCIDAFDRAAPVGVPDIDTTVRWPGFHEAAPRMGLHASVSVPLYAGRGEAVAALNLYGHDRDAMAPVIAGICAVHEEPGNTALLAALEPGGRELIIGYAETLNVRATVRLAIEVIRTRNRCSAEDAYLSLCIRAGDAGVDLAEAASALIADI